MFQMPEKFYLMQLNLKAMDNNKRYTQEENLASRLNAKASTVTEMNLGSFESMLDQEFTDAKTKSTKLKGGFFFTLSSIALIGMASLMYYSMNTDVNELSTHENSNLLEETIDVSKTTMTKDPIDVNESLSITATSIDESNASAKANSNSIKVTKGISIDQNLSRSKINSSLKANEKTQSAFANAITETQIKNNSVSEREDTSLFSKTTSALIEKKNSNTTVTSSQSTNNITTNHTDKLNEKGITLSNKNSFNTSQTVTSTKETDQNNDVIALTEDLKSYKGVSLIDKLALQLKYKSRDQFEILNPTEVIEIEKIKKRISFGINYSIGKIFANEYTPRLLEEFPVEVQNGKTFSFGFLGQYQINNKMFLRTRFNYQSSQQIQIVKGFRFGSQMENLIDARLQATDHELGLGIDLGYNLITDFHGFKLSVGLGTSYRYSISTESDNAFLFPEEISPIEAASESKLAPFAFHGFILLEKEFKNFTLGISPEFTFHKRQVDHQLSLPAADKAYYNTQTSINFIIRFK